MRNKNIKKIILNFLIIFFLIGTFFCLYLILNNKNQVSKENKMLEQFIVSVDNNKITNSYNNDVLEISKVSETTKLEEYRKKYNNDEIVGVLSIDKTKINTLLLQTTNNDYYLRRLPNKEKHITGSVFIDYKTKLDNDKNVIIYGHNANNYDIPFRYLRNYLNKDFYLKHKYIDIETDFSVNKYEIFSVYIADNNYLHLKTSFLDDEAWLSHLNKLKEKSIYGTNISLSANDSIITLQTCLLKDDALIVISAKKV